MAICNSFRKIFKGNSNDWLLTLTEINILGWGHIGMPIATMVMSHGYRVVGVYVNDETIKN